MDLSYFLYPSASREALDETDRYLNIYHNSLSNFLTELGCDPVTLFPFEVLMEHWKKYRKFGLAMALFGLKFMLAGEDDMKKLDSDHQIPKQDEHDRRIIDIVQHFIKTGGIEL